MRAEGLSIPGVWKFDPHVRLDERGLFLESFTSSSVKEVTGRSLDVAQVNTSFSIRGTIRGIHFAQVPPGQAKYVQCTSGSVLDIIVDIRVGSPTFGEWKSVVLDDVSRSAVFVSEGLGHAFCALSDVATVVYLCSEPYSPSGEFGINPLDNQLALPWPEHLDPVLSPKDAAAPTLDEADQLGILPNYAECVAWYEYVRAREPVSTTVKM